jgi:ACR3 family arsenite efflux pump ArsB
VLVNLEHLLGGAVSDILLHLRTVFVFTCAESLCQYLNERHIAESILNKTTTLFFTATGAVTISKDVYLAIAIAIGFYGEHRIIEADFVFCGGVHITLLIY